MSINQPALADQLSRLRIAAQAQQTHAWSLEALIAAILARIFGRLEQWFLLWQSGDLPPPKTNAISDRDPASASGLADSRRAGGQPRSRDRHACVEKPRIAGAKRPPTPWAGRAPPYAVAPLYAIALSAHPRLPARQARAPPRAALKMSRFFGLDRRVLLVTI